MCALFTFAPVKALECCARQFSSVLDTVHARIDDPQRANPAVRQVSVTFIAPEPQVAQAQRNAVACESEVFQHVTAREAATKYAITGSAQPMMINAGGVAP